MSLRKGNSEQVYFSEKRMIYDHSSIPWLTVVTNSNNLRLVYGGSTTTKTLCPCQQSSAATAAYSVCTHPPDSTFNHDWLMFQHTCLPTRLP